MPEPTMRHSEPTPVSGERVMMPPAGSAYNRPPVEKAGTRLAEIHAGLARASWEATPTGQARTRDISQAMHETHGVNASAGQIYDDYRRRGIISRQTGPRHYDVQLPGMVDPDAAPRPPRMEELSANAQAHIHASLAAHGTSIEQMASDFGAQHDQAIGRAISQGHDTPYAANFYSTGEPRQVIRSSAAEVGLPQMVHAQANAFTSPNTKFSHTLKTGETTYPNDMAAKHAILHATGGGDPAALRQQTGARELRKTGLAESWDTRRVQGYPANLEKTAQAVHQYRSGIRPADWRTGEGAGPMGDVSRLNERTGKTEPLGKSPWRSSPKTGPYANSWSDSHPQFVVSDIHTGGGGGVPHLSSFKGTTGQKSERERAIESVPHFHTAMDFAVRQAMVARGLPSVRETQAGQWGEEQLQRREEATTKGISPGSFPTVAQAYPESSRRITKREIPGQESLF